MKRLILSAFLLSMVAFYGYSQSLTLSNSQGTIEPNAIIIQAGTPDSVELITYLNVKNVSNNSLSVLCKKTQLKVLDSTEITMCWAGGCYSASTFISPNAQQMAAGQINTEFVGHYTQTAFHPFTSGESVVRWVFFDRANVNDSASVTIKYTSFPLGIDEANGQQGVLSNAYPNPASGYTGFTYSTAAGSLGKIVIRNILGATMQTQLLSATSGKVTVNTMNLSDGIYFCSLMVDGKTSQTKKLIVKH
jgi:Secretion system C-terminal sorting domain